MLSKKYFGEILSMEKINYFSADYRDGLVTMAGKTYPAGTFATHLLNQYYENDTVARISVE